MVETERGYLLYSAAVLAGIVGLIHLYLGAVGFFEYATTGELPSILPPLFVVSGLAVLVGIYGFRKGLVAPRTVYGGGIALMAVYLVGYADWHVFNVFESYVNLGELGHGHDHGHGDHGHNGHDDHGHDHDDGAVTSLVEHLRDDLLALVSKTGEALLVPVLGYLYVTEDDK